MDVQNSANVDIIEYDEPELNKNTDTSQKKGKCIEFYFEHNIIFIFIYIVVNILVYIVVDIHRFFGNKFNQYIIDNVKNKIIASITGMLMISLLKCCFLFCYHKQKILSTKSAVIEDRGTLMKFNSEMPLLDDDEYSENSWKLITYGSEFSAQFLLIIASLFDFIIHFIKPIYAIDEKESHKQLSFGNVYAADFKFIIMYSFVIIIYLAFDFRLFRHHYFGIIIYSIGAIFQIIFYCCIQIFDFKCTGLMFPYQLLLSGQWLSEYYLINKFYMSFYAIIGIEGIIELIITVLTGVIIIIFGNDVFKYDFNENYKVIIYFSYYLGIILLTFSKFLIFYKNDILKFLCSEMTSSSLCLLISSFFRDIKNDTKYNNIFPLITNIMSLFGVLIFSEIIILKCFKLGDNVAKNIMRRANEEYMMER